MKCSRFMSVPCMTISPLESNTEHFMNSFSGGFDVNDLERRTSCKELLEMQRMGVVEVVEVVEGIRFITVLETYNEVFCIRSHRNITSK